MTASTQASRCYRRLARHSRHHNLSSVPVLSSLHRYALTITNFTTRTLGLILSDA